MPKPEIAANDTSASIPNAGAQSTADVEQIASVLAGSMPDVQEHAVQQARKEQESAESAPRDKNGDLFDPSRHIVGEDGKPQITVRGTFAQKRGRKAGGAQAAAPAQQRTGSVLGGTPQSPAPVDPMAAQIAQSRAAGVAAAELLFIAGQMIGGEEWVPMHNKAMGMDERAVMHDAFGSYFVASGVKDIPPGAALTFAIVAYIAPRFAMPKTQTRFQKIKGSVVTWWVNRKLRKQGLDVQVSAKESNNG